MANPNPYKNYEIPLDIIKAFEERDWESIKKRMQFLLHRSRKFEDCFQREQNRVKKLRKILDDHGIEYDLQYYKERNPYKDPVIQKEER